MITVEDKKFLANCWYVFKDIYRIVREYRHSYNVDANEHVKLEKLVSIFHSNYLNLSVEQFHDYLLDALDFILDNKLKEFMPEDNRYKVWNSIYDCIRELYFGEN